MNPEDELKEGVALLYSLMNDNGFHFVQDAKGFGSGGHFASGYFEKGNRRLNLSVRYSLGCVTYQYEKEEIPHEEYLRAVRAKGEYPGFSKRIIEAFEHLGGDLEKFFVVFLSGTDQELEEIFNMLTQLLRTHLTENEYHTLFLKDSH